MGKGEKRFLCALVFSLIILGTVGWNDLARSQEKYPTRAIDWITPFAPGGGSDLVARMIAGQLRNLWKVPVNVINKPGGNTVPACLDVHNAAPDGYTLLIDSSPSSTYLPMVVKNLSFKPMNRTFIAIVTSTPMVLGVPSSSPIKSMKDAEADAKKDPGQFTWSSHGGAGGADINARLFHSAIGVDILKTKAVVSLGGAAAAALLAGGNVKIAFNVISSALPAIQGGLVRPLAVTSGTRWPALPDVPTTAEVGYPSVNYNYWVGVSGPPNLPPHVIDKWNSTLKEVLKDPEIISKLQNIGVIPFYKDAHEAKEFVTKEAQEGETLFAPK